MPNLYTTLGLLSFALEPSWNFNKFGTQKLWQKKAMIPIARTSRTSESGKRKLQQPCLFWVSPKASRRAWFSSMSCSKKTDWLSDLCVCVSNLLVPRKGASSKNQRIHRHRPWTTPMVCNYWEKKKIFGNSAVSAIYENIWRIWQAKRSGKGPAKAVATFSQAAKLIVKEVSQFV